jgi:prepilin-type N-terminal cleavage/methylation domain-containing protein
MKTVLQTKRTRAMTLLEILVVLAVLTVLVAILMMRTRMNRELALRMRCANNLKQISLGCRIWGSDNNGKFPPFVSATNGGSMEYTTGLNAWRHFQAISDVIKNPKLVICPADTDRITATNFTSLNNSNISYFFGVDAVETNARMFLSGDRNITNGTRVKNGILELTTNTPASWTREMHKKVGNIALADGSVQQLSIAGLRTAVTNTGFATNRLQMPVLTP